MAAIANFSVTVFDGRLQPARPRIGVLDTATGVDGNAVSVGGWGNEPQPIRTAVVVSGSIAAAAALVTQYRRLQGTIVAITDQFGLFWDGVAVLSMIPRISATTFANQWRVEADWLFLPSSVRP